MKKIKNIMKKVVFGFLLIYGYNLIMYPLNLFIPINIPTLIITTIFGTSGFISLISLLIILF